MVRFTARRPAMRMTLALAAAAALTGCTGTEQPTVTVTQSAVTADATPAAPDSSSGESPSSTASGATASPTALPVIATRKGAPQSTGESMEVSLNSVVVNGELMTVTFTARSDASDGWFVGTYFYAGNPNGTAVDTALGGFDPNVDGVYVLDPAAKRRYLVARDKDGECVCSSHVGADMIGPGGEVVLEAVFAAPPSSTATVDVVIPKVGTFAKVPVTRA